jgi:hypothetical protein
MPRRWSFRIGSAPPLRTCVDCGALSTEGRCPTCRQKHEQARGSAHRRGYDAEWRKLAKLAVEIHVAHFGWVCPGYGVEPHPAKDLTGDHLRRPALTLDDVAVLCRGCQNRKGAAR